MAVSSLYNWISIASGGGGLSEVKKRNNGGKG